ncbi:NUDIX hydrolase [Parathalassolituus penaei]|uniref:NUDIX hydrolase n=1 Tax=Parathalassolituus penaei TaxID=2997323 RepID=A0A9X3EG09_9GAMM|nr:NUDIX hydrolase [Parathalassolituus penaei]MCY0966824.1 NUDIX hydrolase [Parathalassolituus penaei]
MNYCSLCGGPITLQIPAGDNRERHVCNHCGSIFYQNPKIVAGTLPVHQGKILLCKRAIEPRKGYWTLPGGFMENGEGTEQAALRETREEACAEVTIRSLFAMISVTHISQVHLFFLADLPKPEFSSGEESLDVRLFAPDEIPWDELAFSTVEQTLRRYLEAPDLQGAMHIFSIHNNHGGVQKVD